MPAGHPGRRAADRLDRCAVNRWRLGRRRPAASRRSAACVLPALNFMRRRALPPQVPSPWRACSHADACHALAACRAALAAAPIAGRRAGGAAGSAAACRRPAAEPGGRHGERRADPHRPTCRRRAGACRTQMRSRCRPQVLFPMLVDQLVDRKALLIQARKQGLRQGSGGAAADAARRRPGAAERAAASATSLPQVDRGGDQGALRQANTPASPARRRCMPATSWWTTRRRRRTIIAQLKKGARFRRRWPRRTATDPARAAGRRSRLLQEGRHAAGVRRPPRSR